MTKQELYSGNVLYGKKWTICGDSFTAGVSGNVIKEGRYQGMNYVYPYLIGNRNDMEIVPFFMGGRTIAFPEDGTFHNSLTDPDQTKVSGTIAYTELKEQISKAALNVSK